MRVLAGKWVRKVAKRFRSGCLVGSNRQYSQVTVAILIWHETNPDVSDVKGTVSVFFLEKTLYLHLVTEAITGNKQTPSHLLPSPYACLVTHPIRPLSQRKDRTA